jgi:hypothetical protein
MVLDVGIHKLAPRLVAAGKGKPRLLHSQAASPSCMPVKRPTDPAM